MIAADIVDMVSPPLAFESAAYRVVRKTCEHTRTTQYRRYAGDPSFASGEETVGYCLNCFSWLITERET